MRVTTSITFKGKILLNIIWALFSFIAIFKRKKWSKPIIGFSENPAQMGFMGGIYLGYKYYFKPPSQYLYKTKDYNFNPSLPNDKTNKDDLCLSIGGDLMPYARINHKDAPHFWDEIGTYYFNADIVFANLETPICTNKKQCLVPEVMLNDMYFNGTSEQYNIFRNNKNKYDILSLANNHSFDQGVEGLEETINFVKNENTQYLGLRLHNDFINKSLKPIEGTVLREDKGIKTGWFAITFSLNKVIPKKNQLHHVDLVNINKVKPNLQRAKILANSLLKRQVDILIASVHGGNAYQNFPSKHIIENYHQLVRECNLDVLIGGHPHNPQPFEIYDYEYNGENKQCFIIYSLGDFVADDIFDWARLPLILKIWLSKNNNKTSIKKVEIQANILHSTQEKGLMLKPINLKGVNFKKILTNKNQQQFLDETFGKFDIKNNFRA